ncbi:MAG: J domain-containing protein [Acidobacteriota bacterium]|nr:J domain-containing protein [Acidobacteriota bacterium]
MLLDDCYRLLDVDSRASLEEVQRAHRDLVKVWHPDRFGHDPSLRRKAEEKLKTINDARDTIRAARESGWRGGNTEPDGRPANSASHWRNQIRVHGSWATTCVLLAILFLLRRPTPAGLVIALILLAAAVVLILRIRAPRRG